ncbi:hypothetical protein K443DRAFT_117783, partial [Laccaria amethystina LaAM-08-1]
FETGSTWKPFTPPSLTRRGTNKYSCQGTARSAHLSLDPNLTFSPNRSTLHIHGFTERTDPRATYSSPSIVGVLMAVGMVSKTLAPYTESIPQPRHWLHMARSPQGRVW